MTDREAPTSRIRDARGRSVTQLDPVMLHVLHRNDVIEADALHKIVEELEPGTAKRYRQMIVIVPCCIALLAFGVAALYYFSDAALRKDLVSTLMNPVIMVPCVLGGVVVPWVAARQARLKRVRFAMLKHLRCPHCGYNLRGLPTAPEDHATVCPECGCAWLIDDRLIEDHLARTPAGTAQIYRKWVAVLLVLLGLAALGAGVAMFLAMS